MSKGNRLRRWLRRHTHWKNTDEFYTALLFECGAPPHPVTLIQIGDYKMPAEQFRWRDHVADVMNERLHHGIDPGHVMQEYLKWLLRQQENGRISGP